MRKMISSKKGTNNMRMVIGGLAVSAYLLFAFIMEHKKDIRAENPNIVVILADDMGFGDIRANNPDSRIPTPNLDKLARSGMRFTDAHSGSAVCTPTRYGLVTGRYAFRSALKKGVLGGYSPSLIEADRYTVADLMKQAGYKTAVIGKWHLGLGMAKTAGTAASDANGWPGPAGLDPSQPLTDGPPDLGFDYSYVLPGSLDMAPYVYYENGKPTEKGIREMAGQNEPRGVFWREGKASEHFDIKKTLDHFGERAISFLKAAAADKKPFFLYLPLTGPHTPWLPADEFKGKSKAGIYGDFVAHNDAVVGRVLETLDQLGIAGNTLVIFTSDNGADWKPGDKAIYPAHQANYLYRGQKSDIWEGGHRVPFLASWPQAVKAGSVVQQTICLTDLMATFAALTSQELPKNAGQDSFDFSGILTGKSKKAPRESTIHHSISGMFAIRSGNWKYVDGQGSGGWSKDESPTAGLTAQLYDMDKDPAESRNVVKEFPEVAKRLKAELDAQKAAGYTRPGAED